MALEMHGIPYLGLYMIIVHVLQVTNTKSSTHWKLNFDSGMVVPSEMEFAAIPVTVPSNESEDELKTKMYNILSTMYKSSGEKWSRSSSGNNNVQSDVCMDCPAAEIVNNLYHEQTLTGEKIDIILKEISSDTSANFGVETHSHVLPSKDLANIAAVTSETASLVAKQREGNEEVLDCGKVANFTYYDHLVGITNRHTHPHVPEPQVSLIFHKRSIKNGEIDIDSLERKLKKAKKEKPKTVHLYNQIGNFWRIKGDTQKSIECFRKALAISPNNAEVLLNLARVLYNLQYLNDAIYLARRSLEVQPSDQSAWMQHYTLGEILKAYGHYQEAAYHLRHTLELKPNFNPALVALRDMEALPDTTLHVYTLLIIIFLVLGVLLGILSSVDSSLDDLQDMKTQRHFNRAMAMKSLRMGISRSGRTRKSGVLC